MSEEFEARAGAPQQPPQEGAEEQEKLPQEELAFLAVSIRRSCRERL